jgi:ERCC4-related helicase
MTTPYHSRYWAELLTLDRPNDDLGSLARSISNSRLDLNPHQVEAAHFALRSPLSKGAILADEVGLGKTIEAGLVIAQRWAERRRRILLIVPASLRMQWLQELESKFFIPSVILETKAYEIVKAEGNPKPFQQSNLVVICSYHFASAKADEIEAVAWDLVVIDEAHRMRNIFKPSTVMSKRIKTAMGNSQKLLLTATPLQNSLMELYGLTSVIDEHIFGGVDSFHEQFTRILTTEDTRNEHLRDRLEAVCIRTLRKQVIEYIPFTARVAITQDFMPTAEEQKLYDLVSEYMQREELYAIPPENRALITLVLRKLLASSTFAIAGTLRGMANRLEGMATGDVIENDEFDTFEELRDEWGEEIPKSDQAEGSSENRVTVASTPGFVAELAELRSYVSLAESITKNAKGEALIPALASALTKAESLGAARKALIFTESRRTQRYLFDLLSRNGYEGEIITISGTNDDEKSRAIYTSWLAKHEGSSSVTGSRAVDTKTAIMEHFKTDGTILIGTETAAEGVNLQFCSLVVNYDLPWNPQRVEQRIGRCHRYGQKHDVVVLNFVNQANAADKRVFELLSQKFHLFDGVFGASDEVLGALESGVDFEKRVSAIYQACRTTEEIERAFDELQAELEEQIETKLEDTRKLLLENFDDFVSERLQVCHDRTVESLHERQRWLLSLTRFELDGRARFSDEEPAFTLDGHAGFHLDWKKAKERNLTFYRLDHPLAQELLQQAKARELPGAAVEFRYSQHPGRLSAIQQLAGQSGWLEVSKLIVNSLDTEEHLLMAGRSDSGETIPEEVCHQLLEVPGMSSEIRQLPPEHELESITEDLVAAVRLETEHRNALFFDEEVVKLDRWADDLKQGLERELRNLDREIREAQRSARLALQLAEKLQAQKHVRDLEQKRMQKRRTLYDEQDRIDRQTDTLIQGIENQLDMNHRVEPVFTFRWRVT